MTQRFAGHYFGQCEASKAGGLTRMTARLIINSHRLGGPPDIPVREVSEMLVINGKEVFTTVDEVVDAQDSVECPKQ